jgi:non-ribosomal peptide synthetase component F
VRNEYLRTRPEVSQLGVVHEYFYAQVLQRPDAQAVCAWDGEYTYAELKGWAALNPTPALPDFMMANMVTVANLDFAKQ